MERTPVAQLIDTMSDLSEEHFMAGWLIDLEHILWGALTGQPFGNYGDFSLTDEERAALQAKSDACHGWIVYRERQGEAWVPMAEWRRLHAERRQYQYAP